MWNQLERFGGGSLRARRRWMRVVSVGVAAAMLAAGVVAVPAVPVASAAPVVPASNGAFLTLTVDPDDVECLANRVVVDAIPTGEPGEFTSALSFNEVPDGWVVRSSWEVTTDGSGGPQTVSLGSVDTVVSDPLGPGGLPLPDAPYVDDVAFGGIVDAGNEFTYTATLQLVDDNDVWSSGLQLVIDCGAEAPGVAVEDLDTEVQPLPPATGALIEPAVIDWELCDSDDVGGIEECGTMTVPLDHFSPDGPRGTTIEVALNRFPAASGDSKGVLVVNPGGPGAPGIGIARALRFIYDGTSLADDYDIVGMDPRGVGESSPAPYCVTPPTPSNGLTNVLAPDWNAFFPIAQPVAAASNSVCSAATARYLGFLGTRQVAADMDWIRQAEDLRRGVDKPLAYFGASYGTRLGAVYLSQSGDNAGSFVLSGAIDPSVTYARFMTDRTGPPDEVFADLFVPAAPEGIGQKFDAVVAALTPVGAASQDREVAAVVDGQQTTITLGGFLGMVLGTLRSEPGWPALAEYISDTFDVVVGGNTMAQIATPDVPEFGDPLPVDPNRPDGASPTGTGGIEVLSAGPVDAASPEELRAGLNTQLIQTVVNCLDLPGVPATAADMAAAAQAVVPGNPPNELGWPFLLALPSCSGLSPSGVVPTDDNGAAKVWPLDPPSEGTQAPLVIGSVGDTATPYEWSVALDEFLEEQGIGSRLLTYDGAEHVAGFSWPPTSCVRDAVTDVFATGDLPGPGELNCEFYSPFPRTPPTNVAGTPGDQTVTLTWELSTQRLGGTVEGFGVELRVVDPAPVGLGVQGDDDDDWDIIEDGPCDPDALGPTDTTCVLSGLTNGTSYEFRMVTLPVLGSPLFSVSSGPVTPQAPPLPPPPPPAPLVIPGVGQVEVTVPSGGDVGFVPVRWEVVATPGAAQCEVLAAEGVCTVSGLSENGLFTFVATAFDDDGTSVASLPSVEVTPGAGSATPEFRDVPAGSFFVRSTSMLKLRGITEGTNPAGDLFSPGRAVNRQQMALFLWRLAGEPAAPASCGFTDEDDISGFAREAACWLKQTGITTNNPYGPTGLVNRQQMAAFLWRFAGQPAALPSCGFVDADDISGFAREAACWLKQTDITTNNPYNPTGIVNRAQMSAFLYRLGAEQDLWVRIDN